jgi:Coenzyme PQQ synthesis protein D (PqqD)
MPMLVSRQFDDEVIVANFETGIYYSLTGTAADIWCGLQCGATAADIASAFAARGGDSVGETGRIVASFIEILLVEKLIGPIGDTVAKSP